MTSESKTFINKIINTKQKEQDKLKAKITKLDKEIETLGHSSINPYNKELLLDIRRNVSKKILNKMNYELDETKKKDLEDQLNTSLKHFDTNFNINVHTDLKDFDYKPN